MSHFRIIENKNLFYFKIVFTEKHKTDRDRNGRQFDNMQTYFNPS